MEAEELQVTAQLARLRISTAEVEKLRLAVERMLAYCSHMASLPVDDLEPTTHALLTSNRLRADGDAADRAARSPSAGGSVSVPADDSLLANAPEREDRFILIPNVL